MGASKASHSALPAAALPAAAARAAAAANPDTRSFPLPPISPCSVFDFKPRSFSPAQYAMLNHFAELTVREMERELVGARACSLRL